MRAFLIGAAAAALFATCAFADDSVMASRFGNTSITTDTNGALRSSSAGMGGFVWTTVLMAMARRAGPAGDVSHAVITRGRTESGGFAR